MKKENIKYPNLLAEMARNGENRITIGKLLGLTSATIGRKLAGKVGWSIKEVETICDYFNKDYNELFK